MEKHDTLLLFSPTKENRIQTREVFQDTFNLLEAQSTRQTLMLLKQNLHCIAAVILDITDMSRVNVEEIHQEENKALLETVPVIILSENDDPDILNRAFGFGASDVIPIGYDPYAMLMRVENIVDLHLHKQHLEAMVEEQKNLLRHTSDTMVDALSSIIEYRSVESGQHILRIRHFTKILLEEVARCCPEYRLNSETIAVICSASALHDIGKIAIPDAILMKPGKLTQEEMEVMKTHAITGCHILDSLGDMADKEYLRYAHNICHYHHERWDGKGYPEGLEEDAIPICAQVVGLADVYDALTSKRVYKDAYSFSKAVNMILRGECGLFSPKLMECFKHVTRQFEELAQAYADGMSPKEEQFETALPAPSADVQAEDTVDRLRGKYYALVHYINGFLIELDMDKKLFHVIYNPYPGLARIQEANTLEDINRMIFQYIHPEDAQKMQDFLTGELPRFLQEGLRRATYHFRIKSQEKQEGELFEVTLLRINPLDNSRRSLAALGRRLENGLPVPRQEQFNTLNESTYCCYNDADFTLKEVGGETHQLAGWTIPEIREQFGGRLLALAHPDDREWIRREFNQQLRQGTGVHLEYRVVYKDGSIHWVYNKSRLITGQDGQEYLYSLLVDVDYAHQDNDFLLEKLQRYEIILAQTENVLFEWDVLADSITFSDTWEKIFGYVPINQNFRQRIMESTFFHPDELPLLIDKINRIEDGSPYEIMEARIATDKGRYLWCRIRATAIRGKHGRLEKISGIIINVDAEKQAEQILQHKAEQDPLTRLLNKEAARKQAEKYFSQYPDGISSALLIIDLDNFKQVNDKYGHLFGDAVLTQAAREIRKLFRSQDIVARIGGDEFMVLMRGISDRTLLEQRCQRLIQTFRNTFQSQRYKLPLSCSIGIAQSPMHGRSYFDLFQCADQALYQAKAKGKNGFAFYDQKDSAFLNQGGTGAMITPIDSNENPGMANDNIVRYAFQKLYASEDMERSINEVLGLIGQKMNVSRVYVFENTEDNRYCSNTYEWCNEGIQPEISNLQKLSYETDIPDYQNNFEENGIFYCPDISLLPKNVYDILAPQGIKSMLQCAIRESGVFRGYIGFDECVEQRMWTKEQIGLLRFLSESLSMFLLHKRRQEKTQQQADELSSILDNQDAWIYIVEPEKYKLKYVNARLKDQIPEIHLNDLCYKALKGRNTPCDYCPLRKLGQEKNACHVKYNEDLQCQVLLDATRIHWGGEDSCLMNCKILPEV